MSRSSETVSLVICMAVLAAVFVLSAEIQAADDGPSALPRREDVSYDQPGVPGPFQGVLSWLTKFDNDAAFADVDSVTPSSWISGSVYLGITWFWREEGLPGDIDFVGYAANLDTTTYDPPMLWLPLDPVSAANWETTATSSKGETWTFRLSYDGLDTLTTGPDTAPKEFICWRILLEQEGPAVAISQGSSYLRDGLGVPREMRAGAKAFSDTLYYEVDALPRRRIRYATAYSQDELLYNSHLTRETPVPNKGTGVSGFKSRYRD